MDGLYVLNNPWSLQSMEKQTTYCAMMHLGLPVPDTWMVPPRDYDFHPDLQATLERYARPFDLGEVGEQLGYPFFMKPYDGGAWVGVNRIDNEGELQKAYEQSGNRLMHLQKSVDPHDLFVRCLGVGPQVRPIRYEPSAALHERYEVAFEFLSRRGGLRPPGHDAHHQHLLRLGLQLVRGAAQGWRLSPDRFRQRLPRLAGDLAPLPLPVAGDGGGALGDLLRRHRPQDAEDARLGSVLRGRRRGSLAAREARTLRRDRGRAARARPLRGVLRRSTSPTSTRSPGSSSAPSEPRKRCA